MLACSTVKRPEIWPEPPVIGCRMRGAEITLLSSTMASGRPTASVVTWPKRWRAADVEAEIDDRLAGALVEAGLGVDQVLALHDDALLDGHAWPPSSCGRQRLDVAGRRAGIGDEAELELRGRAEDLLQALRVLQARHLHEDAVRALALDVRLRRAERVDAAAQHLDGLVDGLADALVDAGFGDGRAGSARRAAR